MEDLERKFEIDLMKAIVGKYCMNHKNCMDVLNCDDCIYQALYEVGYRSSDNMFHNKLVAVLCKIHDSIVDISREVGCEVEW